MDAASDDEIVREVELIFLPRLEVLDRLGLTEADLTNALLTALDEREALAANRDIDDEDIPPLEEMTLIVGNNAYKVEELASVEIRELPSP